MALDLKRLDEKGQTLVEYLLLTSVAFLTAYIVITGPLANFSTGMIQQIKDVTGNIVRNGELKADGFNAGEKGHPSDPARLKPLHL